MVTDHLFTSSSGSDPSVSKSAGTWYLAGSIPVPGTILKPA